MGIARGLREPVIEAAAAGSCHVRDDAIEHLAVGLISIESIVEIGPEETAALRDAKRRRPLDGAAWNRSMRRVMTFVLTLALVPLAVVFLAWALQRRLIYIPASHVPPPAALDRLLPACGPCLPTQWTWSAIVFTSSYVYLLKCSPACRLYLAPCTT